MLPGHGRKSPPYCPSCRSDSRHTAAVSFSDESPGSVSGRLCWAEHTYTHFIKTILKLHQWNPAVCCRLLTWPGPRHDSPEHYTDKQSAAKNMKDESDAEVKLVFLCVPLISWMMTRQPLHPSPHHFESCWKVDDLCFVGWAKSTCKWLLDSGAWALVRSLVMFSPIIVAGKGNLSLLCGDSIENGWRGSSRQYWMDWRQSSTCKKVDTIYLF